MSKVMHIPRLNANDDEVLIQQWQVSQNEKVTKGQLILLLETSKTLVEVESEYDGYIQQAYRVGDKVKVGAPFATFSPSPLADRDPEQDSHDQESKPAQFSTQAWELIQQHNLSIDLFSKDNLVRAKDVEKYINDNATSTECNVRKVPLDMVKQAEVNVIQQSEANRYASSITREFDAEALLTTVAKLPRASAGLFSVLMHHYLNIVAKHPKLNAFFEDNHIAYYNDINLGIAIDLGKGLKVVAIKQANQLSLAELHLAIIDAVDHYYQDQLDVEALTSATTTVSDLSSYKVTSFQPLINREQSVILGIAGDLAKQKQLSFTFVFDHRVLSGAEVAEIANEYIEYLQEVAHEN